jgi:hypothetical protein
MTMKTLSALFVLGLLVPAFCGTTYVLQNGLNDYTGCRDAMIDESLSVASGTDSVLRTSCG